MGKPTFNGWGPNELASSQYAPFSHKIALFSFFVGCRRQKSENMDVSARGRRTPQAPTSRVWGCANARKYDYKSSSLYAQSTQAANEIPVPTKPPLPLPSARLACQQTPSRARAPGSPGGPKSAQQTVRESVTTCHLVVPLWCCNELKTKSMGSYSR